MSTLRTGFLAALAGTLLSTPLAAQRADAGRRCGHRRHRARRRAAADQPRGDRGRRAITQGRDLRHSAQARFENGLCPGVIGLKPDMAALVIDRVRYQAEQLDMQLTEDDGTCAPNLVVAFVTDGKAELASLAEEHPYLFQDMPLHEKRALLAEDGPGAGVDHDAGPHPRRHADPGARKPGRPSGRQHVDGAFEDLPARRARTSSSSWCCSTSRR